MKNTITILMSILVFLAFFSTANAANAAPTVYRNGSGYDLSVKGKPVSILVVTTYPIQSHQPVYTWRTHTRPGGKKGSLGYDGDIVGYTDAFGIFTSIIRLPDESIYCGTFSDEQFSVGSPSIDFPRSKAFEFKIFRGKDIGPKDPNCMHFNLP